MTYHTIHQFLRLVNCVYYLVCFLDVILFLSFFLSSGELYCCNEEPEDEDDAEADENLLEEGSD